MIEEVSTTVDDIVIEGNSMQHEQDETALQVIAGRLADITTIVDVLVEAIDDRDQIINDLSQRVSDLEQDGHYAPH